MKEKTFVVTLRKVAQENKIFLYLKMRNWKTKCPYI